MGLRVLPNNMGNTFHGGAAQWWHRHWYIGGFTSHVSQGGFGGEAHALEATVI